MACIQMPASFPFAVHVQQSKKQQVSNCRELKGIVKNDKKKYDENQNMDVDIQNRYHTGFNSKKRFHRCEPDHTVKHAQ